MGKYSRNVAQSTIHLGIRGEPAEIPRLELLDVNVFKRDAKADPENDEVPFIFSAGDELVIDNSTGKIMKNDERFYEYVSPASNFISIERGNNGVAIAPADAVAEGEITYVTKSL